MRLVLKIVAILFVVIGIGVVSTVVYFYWAFNVDRDCFDTVSYGLGSIESGHNVTKNQIIESLKTAESEFESKYGGDVLIYRERSPQISFNIKYDEYYQKVVNTVDSFNSYYASKSDEYENLLVEFDALKTRYETERKTYEIAKQDYEIQKMVLGSAQDARAKGDITEDEYDTVFAQTEVARQTFLTAESTLNTLSVKIKATGDRVNAIVADINTLNADAKLSQEVVNSNNVPHAFSLFPKPNSLDVGVEYFANTEQLTKIVASAFATIVKPDGYNPKEELVEGTPLNDLFGLDSSNWTFKVCNF